MKKFLRILRRIYGVPDCIQSPELAEEISRVESPCEWRVDWASKPDVTVIVSFDVRKMTMSIEEFRNAAQQAQQVLASVSPCLVRASRQMEEEMLRMSRSSEHGYSPLLNWHRSWGGRKRVQAPTYDRYDG